MATISTAASTASFDATAASTASIDATADDTATPRASTCKYAIRYGRCKNVNCRFEHPDKDDPNRLRPTKSDNPDALRAKLYALYYLEKARRNTIRQEKKNKEELEKRVAEAEREAKLRQNTVNQHRANKDKREQLLTEALRQNKVLQLSLIHI